MDNRNRVEWIERKVDELDFKEVIVRILWEGDWTDKVAHGIGRIRSVFHRPRRDTELPEELRSLVPDMRRVEAAYVEMSEGYKEFLRAVWEAQNQRGWHE